MADRQEIKMLWEEAPRTTTSSGRERGAWAYRSYRQHLEERFPGQRIRKCCLQAGFSCPNLDGTVARGGCAYCDNRAFAPGVTDGTPGPRAKEGSAQTWDRLHRQWRDGRAWLRRRHRRVDGFIAYFQSWSNTHGDPAWLEELYAPLPDLLPECVGVALGTRPDCLGEAVLEVLARLSSRTFLTVEIGLQSDRDQVLRQMNRGHDLACFLEAVRRCAARGLELCVHLMLGVPGEGEDAPERLAALMASLPVASIKIHNLHVVRGTAWARAWTAGRLTAPDRAAHLDGAIRLIKGLRPDQAAQRVIADAPRHLLLSDGWCRDRQSFLSDLRAGLSRREAV